MNLCQLFNSQRRILLFDCESTGLDVEKDRILEFGFQAHHPDGQVDEWRSFIKPGVPIPQESIKMHGITPEALEGCRRCGRRAEEHYTEGISTECVGFQPIPFFKELAPKLARGFTDCDLAGKNLSYDVPLFAAEFARADVVWTWRGARLIDLDRIERLAEPRDLATMYERKTGKKLEGAHGALADARATGELILWDFERYPLERDLDKLHALQFPGLLDLQGRLKMRDGVATVCFGKHNNLPLEKAVAADRRYWTWVCGPESGFGGDVKAIVKDALEGRFPK